MTIRVAALALLGLVGPSLGSPRASAERPNLVWLIGEDQSAWHMALYDDRGTSTPRIEALARDGVVFAHAFSNAPVCSVARTTLVTGCHAPRIGTQYHRREVTVPLPGDLRMFPAYLRAAGYYTTNRQKKDYNAVEGEGVWDASSRQASWRGRAEGQPFFHMQTFTVTHEGSLHFGEEALTNDRPRTDPATVPLPPQYPDTELFRFTLARYRDRIAQLDEQVGAVVDELAADGLLEDTIVFYFSDHGGVLPGTKGYASEEGLHVPLVVRVPERWAHRVPFERGERARGFVSFVDFAPTMLALAGLSVPDEMDGRAFLGAGVDHDEVEARDESLGYADRFDEKSDFVRTLRKGRYRYVRRYRPHLPDALQNNYRYKMLAFTEWRDLYREGALTPVQARFFEARPAEELYDVVADPFQTRNLAREDEHGMLRVELWERLRSRLVQLGDLSFFPESVLVERNFEARGIGRYVTIADMQLLPPSTAVGALEPFLDDPDPDARAWAWTVACAHGDAARELAGRARGVCERDPVRRVRVAAAEFLGLLGEADPGPVLLEALATTRSPEEAVEILNVLVSQRDGPHAWPIVVDPTRLRAEVRAGQNVRRRLEYLALSSPKDR